MSTTTVSVPEVDVDTLPSYHRWLALVSPQHPQLPRHLLKLYFEVDGCPEVEAIAERYEVSLENAGSWQRLLEASLIAPSAYAPVFAAEDAIAVCRQGWQAHEAEVHQMRQRVDTLTAEIRQLDGEKHLDRTPEELTAINAKIAQFDDERATLLRRLEDKPEAGAVIQRALQDTEAALKTAEAALAAAIRTHREQVERQWMQEGLARLEAALCLLRQCGWLGKEAQARVRDKLIQAVRTA